VRRDSRRVEQRVAREARKEPMERRMSDVGVVAVGAVEAVELTTEEQSDSSTSPSTSEDAGDDVPGDAGSYELRRKKLTSGEVHAAATDDKRGMASSVVLASRAFRIVLRRML